MYAQCTRLGIIEVGANVDAAHQQRKVALGVNARQPTTADVATSQNANPRSKALEVESSDGRVDRQRRARACLECGRSPVPTPVGGSEGGRPGDIPSGAPATTAVPAIATTVATIATRVATGVAATVATAQRPAKWDGLRDTEVVGTEIYVGIARDKLRPVKSIDLIRRENLRDGIGCLRIDPLHEEVGFAAVTGKVESDFATAVAETVTTTKAVRRGVVEVQLVENLPALWVVWVLHNPPDCFAKRGAGVDVLRIAKELAWSTEEAASETTAAPASATVAATARLAAISAAVTDRALVAAAWFEAVVRGERGLSQFGGKVGVVVLPLLLCSSGMRNHCAETCYQRSRTRSPNFHS